MAEQPAESAEFNDRLRVRRRGLARILFAILRPGEAGAAVVKADALRLRYRVRFRDFPLGDIEWALVETGWRWADVRLRHAGGEAVVSGLSPVDAREVAAALEAARAAWWRRALAPQLDALRSVHDRLAQFEDPPGYLSLSGFRELKRDSETAAGGISARWLLFGAEL